MAALPGKDIVVRSCGQVSEYEQLVDLQQRVWGCGDREVVPSQMFVVASKSGGQVLAAFVAGQLAGFALAYAGIREGRPYLHSHMAAVLPEFRDLGIGFRLKLAQRDDALDRGIRLIEWTFDPLQPKNAYFNLCCLGAIARRYLLDVYGATSSPLHGGLPTDRLVAEWHLDSLRVLAVLAGTRPEIDPGVERIHIKVEGANAGDLARVQDEAGARFQQLFACGYAATWFEREPEGGCYVLEAL